MANYYIKNGGDDLKDGLSDANAWATVDKVSDEWLNGLFNPDDIISFNRGDSWADDNLRIRANSVGTAGHPITVRAYGTGNKPRLTGTFGMGAGIVIWAADGIEYIDVEDVWIDESSGSGLVFSGVNMDTINIRRITVTDPAQNGILVSGIDTYSIKDCIVSGAGQTGIAIYGSEFSPITNGHVKGNIVHDCVSNGITLHRSDVGSHNIGPNHVLENNKSYDNGEDNYDITAGTNILMRNNEGYGDAIVADGISVDHDVQYLYIENHYSHNEERFLFINDASQVVVSKCKTYNCTTYDILFGNNDPLEDIYLANNSLAAGADQDRSLMRIFDVDGTTTTDIKARNNIFATIEVPSAPHTIISFAAPATPTTVSLDFDYNRHYRYDNDPTQLLWFGGNWANWQGVEGQDINGSFGDPGLVDPANGDFRSGRVCRDAGTWLTTITSGSGSGTSFVVNDALWFHDGFGIVSGSKIQLEGKISSVTVIDVNYGTNTITVDASVSWIVGDGVAFEFIGIAPDIGAHELIPRVELMPRLGEKRRLREARISGITTGIPEYTPPVLGELRGFKLVFYDPSDVKLGQISTEVKEGIISDVGFELMGLGCGAFSFVIDDYPSFEISYRTRVDIHPYFDDDPWFTGFVQTLPQPGKKRPYEYSGFGFFDQLDWVTVNETYPIQAIEDIVKDIIQNTVAPNTQIIYNPAKIEATGYTTQGEIDLYVVPAKKAIESLADLASGFEYGVDNDREFYFRPIDTDLHYDYWAGKHFQNVEIMENPHKIRNRLYIKVGLIQGTGFGWVKEGTNIIGYEEDAGSITTYGLRESLVAAPEILSIADARVWAQQLLTKTATAEIKAKIKNVLFDVTRAKIDAKGKTRITTDDGTEYELFIKRVNYSMSPQGILGSLDLE